MSRVMKSISSRAFWSISETPCSVRKIVWLLASNATTEPIIKVNTAIAISISASVNPYSPAGLDVRDWITSRCGALSCDCVPVFAFIVLPLSRLLLIGHHRVKVDEFGRFACRWVLTLNANRNGQSSVSWVSFATRHDHPAARVGDAALAKRIPCSHGPIGSPSLGGSVRPDDGHRAFGLNVVAAGENYLVVVVRAVGSRSVVVETADYVSVVGAVRSRFCRHPRGIEEPLKRNRSQLFELVLREDSGGREVSRARVGLHRECEHACDADQSHYCNQHCDRCFDHREARFGVGK